MKYFIISVFQKISEHETKYYHTKTLKKTKKIVMIFEDPTKAVFHDKHGNDRYQKNLKILKLITEAVLLSSEQGITFLGQWEQSNYTKSYYKKWVNRGNFIVRINVFAKLDLIFKDHLENGAKM